MVWALVVVAVVALVGGGGILWVGVAEDGAVKEGVSQTGEDERAGAE